jgi:hypothetical protein
MLKFLRRYWPAILLALLLVLDATISSLLTCHPPSSAGQSQNSHEHCTIFQGPLASLIVFIAEFFEAHDKGIVALFTVILAISTILLWGATRNLWIEARQQRSDSKIFADQQFKITQESIKLARDEFISTHRPKIILREAIIGSVLEGEPISVQYHLANIGETTGRIIRSMVRTEVVTRQQRLLLHGSVENQNELGEIVLGPGEAILLKFDRDTPKWNVTQFQEKSMKVATAPGGVLVYRDAKIHFSGQLIYVDDAGTPRRTAFRRELIPERQRFYRIPDEPDQDYGD